MKVRKLNSDQIRPKGWLLGQINKDLNGFIGELDNLVPDIIVNDDIYGKDRLTKDIKKKDVGAVNQDTDCQVQHLWWNSETQSNWLDGLIAHAYLAENEKYIYKAKAYLNRVLNSQDEDGYIGIYDKNLRFNFDGENGELWAQSAFFRAALTYYEINNNEVVLEKIIKAFEVIMEAYKPNESDPFKVDKSSAGVCHGLTLVDSCYKMHRITEDKKYLEFGKWLFENYDTNKLSEEDIKTYNLHHYDYKFKGHAVHTYEHLRALIVANLASGGNYQRAVDMYLTRLSFCVTPSGAPIGDEWIVGRSADATKTGYEYCSIHELLCSYSLLLETTGDVIWAEKMEWLLFNAAFGAKHPKQNKIAYCKTDNSYIMDGHVGGKGVEGDLRYKYSTVHQDVAICCVPNAGRILPCFINSLFMQKEDGIIAMLYGPSNVVFYNKGIKVFIEEITNYPFDLNLSFNIRAETKTRFTLYLRKPSWSDDVNINIENAEIAIENNIIAITKKWDQDVLEVEFKTNIKEHSDLKGDYYYSYGPLLYAMPIEAEEKSGRKYKEHFQDTMYLPLNRDYEKIIVGDKCIDSFCIINKQIDNNYLNPPILEGEFINTSTKVKEIVRLMPIGSTILRKVTFEKKNIY